jgi:anti-anti-sigma regulatory factor
MEALYLDRGVDVALRGELDIAAAPALREQLSEVVTRDGSTSLSTSLSCGTSIGPACRCS